MTLAGLQHAMRQWLETGDSALAAETGVREPAGLDVYLNNYRTQLVDCLEAAFPQTRNWLSQADFGQVARRHIMACPPTAWTLADYPAGFAAGLAEWLPDDLIAAELAVFELALGKAMTAADRLPLTRSMLGSLDWPAVALCHAAGGQLLLQRSNAAAIWSALARGHDAPPPQVADAAISILVWRCDWVPCFRTLDADEIAIFEALWQPTPFTDICAMLAQDLGEQKAVQRLGTLLARWTEDEAVSVAVQETV